MAHSGTLFTVACKTGTTSQRVGVRFERWAKAAPPTRKRAVRLRITLLMLSLFIVAGCMEITLELSEQKWPDVQQLPKCVHEYF